MTSNRCLAATAALAAAAAPLTASCSRTGPVQPYAKDASVAYAGKQALTASGIRPNRPQQGRLHPPASRVPKQNRRRGQQHRLGIHLVSARRPATQSR